jgi:hypothetical protein
MDRILFGDNQFFGVNHASEEKARQQLMRFQSLDSVMQVLKSALDEGVGGFMCTTHDRIEEIAQVVRNNPEDWKGFQFYPCMPYAHKYANAVTEHGYIDAIRRFLPSTGLLDTLARGTKAVLGQDVEAVMKLLVDAEMKPYQDFRPPVIFLQNVVTDLLIGLGFVDAFRIFSDHVRERYGAEAGFITMNLPTLLPMLKDAGIENPIVCANVNKAAFRMSGGIEAYREATRQHSARVIAMSVFASGAIPAKEAIDWVLREPFVQSVLFGASSRQNIASTGKLIRDCDDLRPAA